MPLDSTFEADHAYKFDIKAALRLTIELHESSWIAKCNFKHVAQLSIRWGLIIKTGIKYKELLKNCQNFLPESKNYAWIGNSKKLLQVNNK